MAVLTPYAKANGFYNVRYLGTSEKDMRAGIKADLDKPVDRSNLEKSMNARYDPPGRQSPEPFHAYGYPPGALQHGEAFSMPAQKGEPLYDLYMNGLLTVAGDPPRIPKSSDIDLTDQEDLHFLWNASGTSLWQHLQALWLERFGQPTDQPAPSWPDQRELVKQLQADLEEREDLLRHLVVEVTAQSEKIGRIVPASGGGQYARALRREVAFLDDLAEEINGEVE